MMRRASAWRNGIAVTLILSLPFSTTFPLVVRTANAEEAEGAVAKQLIEDGINAYQAGKYDESVTKLRQARTLAPTNSPTVLYLGLAYLKQGKTDAAIGVWKEYVKLPPTTERERQENLDATVSKYLTLLTREENQRVAREAITKEQQIGPGDPRTVAVAYFQNLGSSDLAVLQKGFAALLINDLSKVKDLKVVERERLQALVDELALQESGAVDKKTAPKVGRLLGAGKVTTGSYVDPTKQQVRIDAVVADSATAQPVGVQQVDGKLAEFYDLEKNLALAILADLGYSKDRLRSEGVLAPIEKPQTTSFPALTAFSMGLDAKDRQDYAAARVDFDEALKADPGFDLARTELIALPVAALAVGGIVAGVAASAPSASAATAGMAGATTGGISGTTVAIGAGIAAAAGGIAAGVALSGGGGGGKHATATPVVTPTLTPTITVTPPITPTVTPSTTVTPTPCSPIIIATGCTCQTFGGGGDTAGADACLIAFVTSNPCGGTVPAVIEFTISNGSTCFDSESNPVQISAQGGTKTFAPACGFNPPPQVSSVFLASGGRRLPGPGAVCQVPAPPPDGGGL